MGREDSVARRLPALGLATLAICFCFPLPGPSVWSPALNWWLDQVSWGAAAALFEWHKGRVGVWSDWPPGQAPCGLLFTRPDMH
jgi:hypothetical protein